MTKRRLSFNTFSTPKASANWCLQAAVRFGVDALGLFSEHAAELANENTVFQATGVFVRFFSLGSERIPEDYCGWAQRRFAAPVTVIPQGPHFSAQRFAEELRKMLVALPTANILIEPLHPSMSEVTCLLRLESALEAIAALAAMDESAASRASIVLDVAHCDAEAIFRLSRQDISQISIVHLSDLKERYLSCDPNDRLPPGEGRAPLADIVDHLDGLGYGGWWEVEMGRPFATDEETWRRSILSTKRLLKI